MQPTPVTPTQPSADTLGHGPCISVAPLTPAASAVLDAEAELVEALLRLREMKRAALLGSTYNADAYDAAICAYRHARAAAEDAREHWKRSLATVEPHVAWAAYTG